MNYIALLAFSLHIHHLLTNVYVNGVILLKIPDITIPRPLIFRHSSTLLAVDDSTNPTICL